MHYSTFKRKTPALSPEVRATCTHTATLSQVLEWHD
jgi:hypothetical protein